MTKRINPADYLDHPEKAVALLNEVLSIGGSDRAIQQAVAVLIRSLAARRLWRRATGAPPLRTNGPPKRPGAEVNKVSRVRPSESVGCPQALEMVRRSEPSSRGVRSCKPKRS